MALTPSNMTPLGNFAPDFKLQVTDGTWVSLSSRTDAKAYLVMFICNHCPYVVHIRKELARFTSEYLKKDVAIYGINANDPVNYPEDSPEKMKVEKKKMGYEFPYLFDETQEVAQAYDAACTPDFFLYDREKKLVYRGQFDDSRPGNKEPVNGKDLRDALNALLSGKTPAKEQKPSIGCNIKWRH